MTKFLSVAALLVGLLFGGAANAAGARPSDMTASSAIVGTQIVWCPVGTVADFKCTFTQVATFTNAQMLPSAVTAGNIIVGGPSTSQIQDGASASAGYLNSPFGINFANNLTYSGAFGSSQTWANVPGGSLSGTATAPTDGQISPLHFYISGDTVDTTTNGNGTLDGLVVAHRSSAGLTGTRQAILGFENVLGTPSITGNGYIAGAFQTRVAANLGGTTGVAANYKGGVFGGNTNVFSISGATFLSLFNSLEMDTALVTGSSAAEKHGATIVQTTLDAVRGTYDDSALSFNNQNCSGACSWLYGISFGSPLHYWPYSSTDSTLIGAQAPISGSAVAKWGVDLSPVTFTSGGGAFKSTGFLVDPSGNTSGLSFQPTGGTCTSGVTGLYLPAANSEAFCVNGTETFLSTAFLVTSFKPVNIAGTVSTVSGSASLGGTSALGGVYSGKGGSGIDVTLQNNSGSVGIQLSNAATTVVSMPNVATGTAAFSVCQDASNNIIHASGTNCFAGGGSAGGSANQVQWNSAGSLAGFTFSGDMTLVTSTGVATLKNTGPGATGPLGSATVAPIVTIDAQGRVTALSSATVTPAVGSITGLGTGVATAAGNATNAAGGLITVGNAVTSITPGGGVVSSTAAAYSQTAVTTAGTLSNAEAVNAQVGTSYAIADGDRAKLITGTNAATQAYTIAQAGASTTFQTGWYARVQNKGTGPLTITPTTSTINGASSYTVYPGSTIKITSDGTNYQVDAGSAPGVAVNPQAGANYAFASSDYGKVVNLSNASNQIPTLSQATGVFGAGWFTAACNQGAGTQTITPATSTIGGAATYVLRAASAAAPVCVNIVSDGTNYQIVPEAGFGTLSGAVKASGGQLSQAACADLSNGATGCSTATGTSGATLPLLNGTNTFSGTQTFGSVFGSVSAQAGTTYTLQASDCGTEVDFTNAAAVTVTIPAALTTGCNIVILQTTAAGQVTVTGTAVSAATLHSAHSYTKTFGQWAAIGINIYTTGVAILTGDGA